MSIESGSISKAIECVFSESSDFIVIGLTGRTGSGCTTSAEILINEKIPLPRTESSHFVGNELRKYRIIKKYMKKKWHPFMCLQIRSVISRYILKLNFSEFTQFVAKSVNEELPVIQRVLQKFRKDYDLAHLKIESFMELSEEKLDDINTKMAEAYKLYFEWLPIFSNKLRDVLKDISESAYTTIYQIAGDNIRSSGSASSDQFDSSKVFGFSKTINKIIKSARYHCKQNNKPCNIVLDAIRNPYEAVYLKDRYASFYLVSVNTKNKNRLEHLRKSHKFSEQQIIDLDKKEYPSKLTREQKYTSQNIQKCIEISDVHVNNPRDDDYDNSELASQLAWYISLMLHPGLVMPTSMESCMQLAYSVKKNSGCISRQVGAVVTDSVYSVKAVGWNNTAQGQVPCLLRNAEDLLNGTKEKIYSKYERNNAGFRKALEGKYINLIDKADDIGRNLSFCFKDIQNEVENEKNQVHTRSLHAEENAFLQIAKYGGQKLKGGILFTTASPCELCAKKAYQLGLTKIFFIDPYPGIASSHILSVGDERPELILFRGAIGTAFHRLYQPIMPYKDELDMFLSIPIKENKKVALIKKLEDENSNLKLQNENLLKQLELVKERNIGNGIEEK